MSRPRRRRVLRWAATALVVFALGVSALAVTGVIGAPSVQSITTEWGTVTDETSEIRVVVSVANPNPVGVPAVAGVAYVVRMNDVVVADARRGGVGLDRGENVLRLSVPVQNDRIVDWWVTHVNGREQSTMRIDTRLEGPLGLGLGLPAQRQPIETDFLGSLSADEEAAVELDGAPFVVIGEQSATWGEATEEETPLVLTARLSNQHDAAITFDRLGYAVRMDDVVLGEGSTDVPVRVDPAETTDLVVDARLHTPRISDWWVGHLRRGERTNLTVAVYGVVDAEGSDPVSIPLVEQTSVVTTDLLGSGEATVEAAPSGGPSFDVTRPTVTGTTLEWGTVTDDVTEVEARVGLRNPNVDSPIADLLALDVEHAVTINEVPVAAGRTRVDRLPAEEGTVEIVAELGNEKVPEWWARHLNGGERSAVTFATGGAVDAGMTTFPLETPAEDRRFETDLLAEMRSDEPRPLHVSGRPLLSVQSSRASWGTATAEWAPIETAATVRNDGEAPATIRDVTYRVTINDVVLADRDAPGTWTIPPDETRTVDPRLVLNNSRMAAWWPTHVRNDEVSTLSVEVFVTVDAGPATERVAFDALGTNTTVETDILGREEPDPDGERGS